jgi:hypothetical protein
LSEGLDLDVALQKAKIEFMETGSKENQLPWFWAATILAGKTDAIEFEKPSQQKAIVFLIGIISVLTFLGYKLWNGWKIRKKL